VIFKTQKCNIYVILFCEICANFGEICGFQKPLFSFLRGTFLTSCIVFEALTFSNVVTVSSYHATISSLGECIFQLHLGMSSLELQFLISLVFHRFFVLCELRLLSTCKWCLTYLAKYLVTTVAQVFERKFMLVVELSQPFLSSRIRHHFWK